ncbi:hypothetical protein [Streptomyces tsukubensis]|uniref:hypothetical protein n=1 Tax=Streptomyces tsukubensis TaxID=83656 RepID=UPI00344BE791
MLGLLGFYDEFDAQPGRPNGSIYDAVQPAGEPDEADLVSYLDSGHVLLDVMEGGSDVITGDPHRHSSGCSSLVTDGLWLWRLDFPHYVETYHVRLPSDFIEHARENNYQVPPVNVAEFAPQYNEALPLVGWLSTVPWRPAVSIIEPRERHVTSKAEFEAALLTKQRNRPQGSWSKKRKPRRR